LRTTAQCRIDDLDALAIEDEARRRPGIEALLTRRGGFNVRAAWAHEGHAIRTFLDAAWSVRAEPKNLAQNVARLKSKRAPKRTAAHLPPDPPFLGLPMASRLRAYYALNEMLSQRAAALREIAMEDPKVISIGGDHLQFLIDGISMHGINVGVWIAEAELARDIEKTNGMARLANGVVGARQFAELIFVPSHHGVEPSDVMHEIRAIESFLETHWNLEVAPRIAIEGEAPVAALIGLILRRGIGIARTTIAMTYGATLDKRRREVTSKMLIAPAMKGAFLSKN
jgi:hypothetical protein